MKKKMMTKVKRLVKEIYLLKQTENTVKDLAELFNISVKTIQRDLKDIESLKICELKKVKRNYKLFDKQNKRRFKSIITKDEKM